MVTDPSPLDAISPQVHTRLSQSISQSITQSLSLSLSVSLFSLSLSLSLSLSPTHSTVRTCFFISKYQRPSLLTYIFNENHWWSSVISFHAIAFFGCFFHILPFSQVACTHFVIAFLGQNKNLVAQNNPLTLLSTCTCRPHGNSYNFSNQPHVSKKKDIPRFFLVFGEPCVRLFNSSGACSTLPLSL